MPTTNMTIAEMMNFRFIASSRSFPLSMEQRRLPGSIDQRDEGRHFGGVACVLLGKDLAHEALLDADLAQDPAREQDERDQAAPLAERDGGAEDRREQPGVDRVADNAIRAGADELVPLHQRDGAAPVVSQVMPCPGREGETGGEQGRARPVGSRALRQEALGQPAQRDVLRRQQDRADEQRHQIAGARQGRFSALDGLAVTGRHDPVGKPGQPEPGDQGAIGPVGHARGLRAASFYTSIVTGRSTKPLKAPRSSAPSVPSTTRWSHASVTVIWLTKRTPPSSLSVGRCCAAPTARMVACGGLMTAENSRMPYMPSLEIAAEPHWCFCGLSLRARARAERAVIAGASALSDHGGG